MTLKNRLRLLANRVLEPLGLGIYREELIDELEQRRMNAHRLSLRGMLEHAQSIGFVPQTCIDVGAAYGTPAIYETFPQAHHLLLEPLAEYEPALERLSAMYPKLDYRIVAAAEQTGTLTINVHPDLVGSSLYREEEDSNVNGVPRDIPTETLDTLVRNANLPPPYLIKADVQGAELDVLRGASDILQGTEYIVLEVALFEFYKGAPILHEVIDFMAARDFVPYDVGDASYRPLDGAVAQMDVAFVKRGGLFREHQHFATAAQRAEWNRIIQQQTQAKLAP